MSQRDREGRLALKPRLPHNQRTHPSDCKAGARKKPSPLGEGGADRRRKGGNSLSNQDCPPTNAPTPATAKQEQEKSRPLWGKVAPTGDGRGELTLKPRLPPNKDTEPSLPSMELRGGGPVRARRGVTPSHNHHSLST